MTLPANYATRGIRSVTRTLDFHIRKADPDFNRDRRNDLEYEMSRGRQFWSFGRRRGAADPDSYTPNSIIDGLGIPIEADGDDYLTQR